MERLIKAFNKQLTQGMSPLASLELPPPRGEPGGERLSGWAKWVQTVGLGLLSPSPKYKRINKQLGMGERLRAGGSPELYPFSIKTADRFREAQALRPSELGPLQGCECPLLVRSSAH